MKKLLIVITAFVLLGLFASAGFANGPFKDKDQLITTSPLLGQKFTCTVINLSNADLRVKGTLLTGFGPLDDERILTPMQATTLGIEFSAGARSTGICIYEWYGKREDVKGSICTISDTVAGGCVDAS